MKTSLTTIILLFISSLLFCQENYEVIIDGKGQAIELGKTYNVKTKSGETVTVQVNEKQIKTYTDNLLSFEYPKENTVSSSKQQDNSFQISLFSPNGCGFYIQEMDSYVLGDYTVDMYIAEMTKADLSYGYTKSESPFNIKLNSGHTLNGKKVMLNYHSQQKTLYILYHYNQGMGIVVSAILNEVATADDQRIIDLLFSSLALKK